ncbi:MAG TPA: methyltransferase domain-containing protein [Candidatus Fraserbacteria bacterium]|nr:methyltransferase domain-containing protein [Candidatus Fraserbacteria bacterium]
MVIENRESPGQAEWILGKIQKIYSQRAASYNQHVRWLSLGLQRKLRQYITAKLDLQPGQTVLEVACGTGLNFSAIQAAIGPEGRLIGFDYTPAMLDQAKKQIEHQGWQNVSLMQGDVLQLQLAEPVDAILCTFAIGLFPSPRRALERMVAALRPGGRILIADCKLFERWYGFGVNPVLKYLTRPWVPSIEGYFGVQPWSDLQELLGETRYEEQFGGLVYLAWGEI